MQTDLYIFNLYTVKCTFLLQHVHEYQFFYLKIKLTL